MSASGSDGTPIDARWRPAAWAAAAVLVVAPLLALQAAGDFRWQPVHVVLATVIVLAAGTAAEVALRTPPRRAFAAAVALALLGIALTVWFNGAVGIIGSEDHPANRAFLFVVGTAIAGIAAASRPSAAAWAMVLAATAQLGVCVWAAAAGHGFVGPITVFFCALWLASAALFRTAGHHRARHPALR